MTGGIWMMWLWAILLVAPLVGGVIAARVLWNRFGSDKQASRQGRWPAMEVLEEVQAGCRSRLEGMAGLTSRQNSATHRHNQGRA